MTADPQVTEFRCPRCNAPVHIQHVEVFTTKLRVEVSRAGDVHTDDELRAGPSWYDPGLRIHLFCESEAKSCSGRSVLSIAEHKGQFIAKVGTDPGEKLTSITLNEARRQQRGEG